MSDTQSQIDRRTVLKALVAAGVGAAGLPTRTRAQAGASVSIDDASVSLDDGDVSFIDLVVSDYTATWDGFDVPVAAVAFRDVIENVNDPGASHVLYDQKGVDAQPVLLENISSQGSGGDGWGGAGEYASEDPSTYVQATGPATSGFVHADVDWRILSADGTGAKSIENPGDTDDFGLDVDTDGSTETTTLRLRKQVWLYRLPGNGESADLQTQDGTGVVLMGSTEGTLEKAEATPEFDVTVTNEEATTSTSGSGSGSGG